jgi:oxygen-independent coproporphyrinogen-3 oxidase
LPGIYVHIPFCEHKCIYCDFYSIAPTGGPSDYNALINQFLEGLHREIEMRGEDARFHTSYDTVFFGGGTPSLLAPSSIKEILQHLAQWFPIDSAAEVTLETNPGTVDVHKMLGYKSVGINRVSFGIQSFHDDDLRFLTRIHNSAQAQDAVRDAAHAGFENTSIDLIYALPNQSRERWKENLLKAVELGTQHISCYSLIVEPNTPLHRMVEAKQVTLLDVEDDAAMFEETVETLEGSGFLQYEVSNFAKPGYKCKHNLNYWNHENYLSFGPSAHSFWNGKRWWNFSNVVGYAELLRKDQLPVAGEEILTDQQWFDETVMLGLRSEGIDLVRYRKRFKKDLREQFKPLVDKLLEERLAKLAEDRLQLTAKGYLLCDEICRSFR